MIQNRMVRECEFPDFIKELKPPRERERVSPHYLQLGETDTSNEELQFTVSFTPNTFYSMESQAVA